MPTDLLPVPLIEQESDGACLPACARMILAYLGLSHSEPQLARILSTQPAGTPAYHIRRLETLGVKVTYGQMSEARLRASVSAGVPVIAFVQAGELPYWHHESFHAVVIVGVTGDAVVINDPAFTTVQSVTWDDLMLAWSEFDYAFAIITL
jgi:ABC-type bacteriocin/lantibiotic exporter with double-glycine peptidase domain